MKVRQISFKTVIIVLAVLEALVLIPIVVYSILNK
jgi:hypothetical protein